MPQSQIIVDPGAEEADLTPSGPRRIADVALGCPNCGHRRVRLGHNDFVCNNCAMRIDFEDVRVYIVGNKPEAVERAARHVRRWRERGYGFVCGLIASASAFLASWVTMFDFMGLKDWFQGLLKLLAR